MGEANGLVCSELSLLWFWLREWIEVRLLEEAECTEFRMDPLEMSRCVRDLLNVELTLGSSILLGPSLSNSSKSM